MSAFEEWLQADMQRAYFHRSYMETAMRFNERLIGVPYGPALCEVRRYKLMGILP